MIFTLHQWLQLASIPVITGAVCYLMAKLGIAVEARVEKRHYRQLQKRLKEIEKMPN